ncbi:MAG: 5-(carboxyamino)imidazole ribonucleotide mutase [Firmicutes bacterium]|nr:5-(carboxyamino)imidazole ribonucleotide mutase [[Eubacterium] siraeum]MCM1487133.1 5-(carboxyamino)imidazole ribonucleotide mutase [Bacillota bacterium]
MKKVAIIMGSDSDLPVVQKAAELLKDYGIPCEMRVMSAHRCPDKVAEFSRNAEKEGCGVIIAAAGMAAHLAGAIAANTTLPVIGIPIKSTLEGMDALLATVQMPSGIPVATVGINNAKNAAILAAQILALGEPTLADRLKAERIKMTEEVAAKDEKLLAQQ